MTAGERGERRAGVLPPSPVATGLILARASADSRISRLDPPREFLRFRLGIREQEVRWDAPLGELLAPIRDDHARRAADFLEAYRRNAEAYAAAPIERRRDLLAETESLVENLFEDLGAEREPENRPLPAAEKTPFFEDARRRGEPLARARRARRLSGGVGGAHLAARPDSRRAGQYAPFLRELLRRRNRGALVHALGEAEQLAPASFGFHGGRVGVAWAASRLAEVFDRPRHADAARRLLAPLRGRERLDRGLDVIDGAGGAIPALLDLAARLSSDELLETARELGGHLIDKAHREPGGWAWNSAGSSAVRGSAQTAASRR